MLSPTHEICSLEDLRDYVHETFCDRYQLEVDAFHMTERTLRRGGKPCGLYFCLHGPRQVKFTAIWETDRNRVLFYTPTGERFRDVQLVECLSVEGFAPGRLERVAA
jgi:hypothetical protein